MSSRPVIGMATQSLEAIPGKLPPCWVMGQRYVRVLAAADLQYSRDYLADPVRVDAGTRLGRLLGDETPVNSMHHQGLKRLAPGLRASAFAPDGLVEGVESENGHYLVGVQWHPEELAEA